MNNTKQIISAENFNGLMQTSIDKLGLSARSFKGLLRLGINTIGDLVKASEEQIIKIRALGKKSILDIKLCLQNYGLALRPENISELAWIDQFKAGLNIEKEDVIIKSIEELPTRRRGRYADNTGAKIQQDLKNGMVKRVLSSNSRNALSLNGVKGKTLPRIRLDKAPTVEETIEKTDKFLSERKGPETLFAKSIQRERDRLEVVKKITDEQKILKYLKENILSIYDLEQDYIRQHNQKLIDFILDDESIEDSEKFKLIRFVNDARKYTYTL